MYEEVDLVSEAPLQRWDTELPQAPTEAGKKLVIPVICVGLRLGSIDKRLDIGQKSPPAAMGPGALPDASGSR